MRSTMIWNDLNVKRIIEPYAISVATLLSTLVSNCARSVGRVNMLCCALYLFRFALLVWCSAHDTLKPREEQKKPVRLFILNDFLFDLHMRMSNTFHEQYGYSFLVTNFCPSSIKPKQNITIDSFNCTEASWLACFFLRFMVVVVVWLGLSI